jgi:hypothetical protein
LDIRAHGDAHAERMPDVGIVKFRGTTDFDMLFRLTKLTAQPNLMSQTHT